MNGLIALVTVLVLFAILFPPISKFVKEKRETKKAKIKAQTEKLISTIKGHLDYYTNEIELEITLEDRRSSKQVRNLLNKVLSFKKQIISLQETLPVTLGIFFEHIRPKLLELDKLAEETDDPTKRRELDTIRAYISSALHIFKA